LKYEEKEMLMMMSRVNGGIRSEDDIETMGLRLAHELKQWIMDECPREDFSKLSFVAHSIGGMVVRAALPHLERFKLKMTTLITLGTPHLGYLVEASTLVKSGFWFIRKT
jgi:triacylglycerol esterase/lipase EstA (alpha/beta hydrolase family)